jgi:phosphoserine aminotransferase
MGLSIRFTFDPPTPYHTLGFHLNRGIRQKLMEEEISRRSLPGILTDLASGLKMLTEFPDNYSVILLPSMISAYGILEKLYGPGTLIVPAHPSTGIPAPGLPDSRLKIVSFRPGDYSTFIHQLNTDMVICRDIDTLTGFALSIQEIQALKMRHPDLHICLDLSCSFMNYPLDMHSVDAYLFDITPVTGIHPAITLLIVRQPLDKAALEIWPDSLHKPLPGAGGNPEIFFHREVDILSLFVFKEICYDLIRRDPTIIRNEIIYKSIILYEAFENNLHFSLIVGEPQDRSPNVIVAGLVSEPETILSIFKKKRILFDVLMDEKSGLMIRFSNFPVHSREQMEMLTDIIASM